MLEGLKGIAWEWLGPTPTSVNESPALAQPDPPPSAVSTTTKQLTDIANEYSYDELKASTGNFSSSNQLGSGAAGAVFRGVLKSGTEVAVKKLKDAGDLSGFEDEVRVLSRFRHPNLVTLLGYGQHETDKYLLYELLTGGDVSKRLEQSRKGKEMFLWQHRLKVTVDAACGLSYMMNSKPKAFHRDIKPPNIILDQHGTAKMADFGLAGIIHNSECNSLIVEHISGTPGYACPSYLQSGKVMEESEVYSFGTVVLELLMNMPPALQGKNGELYYPLLQTAQPAIPGAHERIASHLDKSAEWPRPAVDDIMQLALACVDMRSSRRPLFETLVKQFRSIYQANCVTGKSWGVPLSTSRCGEMDALKRCSHAAPASIQQKLDVGGLSEIVLDCIHADGIVLETLPAVKRAIAFSVDPQTRRLCASVGRCHQPEFFEMMVPKKERFLCISRSQLEIFCEPCSVPMLRKLSAAVLFVDDSIVNLNETVPLRNGARITFSGATENDAHFLILQVIWRTFPVVQGSPHPASIIGGKHPAQLKASPKPNIRVALECIHAVGATRGKVVPETRAIMLPFNETIEIGRQHQHGLFEYLLSAEPAWITFISRTHLRVHLSGDDFQCTLWVENLSFNAIRAGGRRLSKGASGSVVEGSTVCFLAKNGSSELAFLEFEVRRACQQNNLG